MNLFAAFASDSAAAYRVAAIVASVTTAALATALIATGCSHVRVGPWDSIILLDGGWRVVNGQVPHANFFSPIGPVPLYAVALGLKAAGPSADALGWAAGLILPVIAVLAWVVARPRLGAVFALVFVLIEVTLVAGQNVFGVGINLTSHIAWYNRLGWAFFSLMALEAFQPPVRRDPAGAAVSGLALALALFTKINFFAAGLLIVASACLFPEGRRRIAADSKFTVAGFGLGFLAVLLALNWHLLEYLKDLRLLASGHTPAGRFEALVEKTTGTYGWLLVAFGVYLLGYIGISGRAALAGTFIRSALLIAIGLLAASANDDESATPCFALAALLFAETLRRKKSIEFGSARRAWVVIGLGLFAAQIVVLSGGSVAYATAWHFRRAPTIPPDAHIDAPSLRTLYLPPTEAEREAGAEAVKAAHDEGIGRGLFSAWGYALFVNDGLDLIRPRCGSSSRVLCLDYSNPFPFALGLPPPSGDCLWWHAGRTCGDLFHVPPERVFRDATLVLVPKWFMLPETGEFLHRTYDGTLNERFRTVGESRLWLLWERR